MYINLLTLYPYLFQLLRSIVTEESLKPLIICSFNCIVRYRVACCTTEHPGRKWRFFTWLETFIDYRILIDQNYREFIIRKCAIKHDSYILGKDSIGQESHNLLFGNISTTTWLPKGINYGSGSLLRVAAVKCLGCKYQVYNCLNRYRDLFEPKTKVFLLRYNDNKGKQQIKLIQKIWNNLNARVLHCY